MAWSIYQRPGYSRLRRIILIHFPPPSEVTARFLTNTGLEAKYPHFFLSERAKKISKLFFTALIIPKKRYHLFFMEAAIQREVPKPKHHPHKPPPHFSAMPVQNWCEIFMSSLLLLNVLITHLGPAQTHPKFTSSEILNHLKAEPFWQIFWSYTDSGWSLVSLLHIHSREPSLQL